VEVVVGDAVVSLQRPFGRKRLRHPLPPTGSPYPATREQRSLARR
jgi:hypothetical protein